jgi:hypothetical protein
MAKKFEHMKYNLNKKGWISENLVRKENFPPRKRGEYWLESHNSVITRALIG